MVSVYLTVVFSTCDMSRDGCLLSRTTITLFLWLVLIADMRRTPQPHAGQCLN